MEQTEKTSQECSKKKKRKKGISPTQRSLKYLRDAGYEAEVTEHWNAFAMIRQDLYGFIDIVATGNGKILGVQTTTKENMQARIEKIQSMPNRAATGLLLPELKACGWTIVVQGWKRPTKTKNKQWELVEVIL